MRPTPFQPVRTGIASLIVVAVVGTILAYASAPPTVAAQPQADPQFFSWEGDPFGDGLNHYLVSIVAADTSDGWLQLRDSHLIATATAPSHVAPGQIDAVVGETATRVGPDEIVADISSRPDIESVAPVAFGIYAVAGTIDLPDLRAIPGVTEATPDPALDAATLDPYFPSQWGLDNDGDSTDPWVVINDADIDAPEGWHRTRGAGVVVAVIDSGVDVTHPDLAASIWDNPGEQCGNGVDDDGNGYVDDCHGWDFANGVASVTDHVGHGTHVAGIIAAEANNGIGVAGVAHEAEVMALKIGDGAPALSAALEAISYAIANDAKVINASWVVNDPAAAAFLDIAIAAAEEAGVLVVAAAGNEPVDIDSTPFFPAASAFDNVITVAASTPTDNPANWSAFGDTNVDIYAPGEYIISTVPRGYGIYSGTSMAAPMVSGAAALLWAAAPEASYAEVKDALLDRSDGPNEGITAFRDLATSDGRLNIDRALYSNPLFRPPVMYEFYDFDNFEPESQHNVSITAKTIDPWMVPPQTAAMYRIGLYVPREGSAMAVVGHEITYAGDGVGQTTVTDASGRALIGTEFEPHQRAELVQGGDVTQLTMALPAGAYALVMELVDVGNAVTPLTLGDPSAVFFVVDSSGSVSEMPQIPIGGSPPPETTTTLAAVSTTTPITSTTGATTVPTTTGGVTTTTPATTTPAPASTTSTTGAPAPTTTVAVTSTTASPPTTTATTTTTLPTATSTTGAATTTTTTTTTTAAPTTTAPTPPTTTTSPTTTTAAPSDGMAITSINPSEGPITGHVLATITGRHLPDDPEVYFGERSAEIVAVMAPSFIVVDVPSGDAGWTDLRVTDRVTGEEALLQNGFAYIQEGQQPPPSTTTTTFAVGSTTTPPAPTTWAPTTTTSPGATTSTLPTTTTAPQSPTEEGFLDWRDSLLQTPEGLTLAPPAAGDPINGIPVDLWVGALCDEPVCPGWVLEQ